ncbi:ExeM/NucH family extracellular endonuclease [Microbacterium sp. MMO-10]|uniref:ExeM/NucH family extracellular endonuclease n=1 Tax=Microbacterium sp. MMO-10 TaxID=3081272 RepID=UPI003017C346
MTSVPTGENRAVPAVNRRRRARLCALAVTTVSAVGFGSLVALPAFANTSGTGVVINEVYLSGGSAGAAFKNKFVELYNPTDAAIPLDGTSVQYRSATGTAGFTGVVPLAGSIPAHGYYLIQGGSNASNGADLPTPDATGGLNPSGTSGTIALVNSASAVALPTGSLAGSPDVIDLLGYGTSNTYEGAVAGAPTGNTDVRSLNRAQGADTDANAADFSLSATITPTNTKNNATDPDPEPTPTPTPTDTSAPGASKTIAEVQGTTDTSPLVDQTVTVQGVVTGDYRVGGYKGITIQTQGTGGDTKTAGASDGIFVFLNALTPSVARGDLVSVTGKVSEYFGQTQITPAALGDVSVVTAGVGVPQPVALPDSVRGGDREAYENMLVAPTGTYKLASSHQLYNYGALWLNAGDKLNVKATELARPGADADAITAANRANRILLDDGWSSQIGKGGHTGGQPYFTKDTVVRNGDTVNFPAEGEILQYGFDDWRLQPVVPIDGTSAASHKPTFGNENARTTAPPAVGGDVKVASFNVYNFFTTLSSQDANARGAKTDAQFQIQRSKIVSAINGLGADVVGLMEVENGPKFGLALDAPLQNLVQGLNDAAGAEVWDYVRTPAALNDTSITDVITTAIIYKKASVTLKGDASTIVDETVFGNAREPIAQTFQTSQGRVLSVITTHLKSKSPPQNAGPEPADGQGFFNADRVAQAKAELAFAQQVQKSSGSDDVFLVGDFNAYGKEDPIDVFSQAGWTDVEPTFATGQYTYSFDGELGSLDHVIASPSAAKAITGAGVWNINSPEWSDRGYAFAATETGTPYRSSDHDPIVVGLKGAADPIDINIATINDFHGRIEADSAAAGAAVVAGAVQEFRAQNPNTIFAAAGDLIGASTFTSFIQQDNPTIDALNAAGLDVSAAGNHEFDQGYADLRDRVIPRADWTYLSSNVFLTADGKPALTPSWVKDVQGVKVGFIGAVTEDLPTLVSPDGMKGLEVRDIPTSVNKVAAALKDGDPSNGEADVIILLVHEGATTTDVASITPESRLGEIVNGVDKSVNAIVSAHTHLAYNHVIDGRPVVSAGQYGENMGLMDLKVDPTTKKLLSITNEIKPLAKQITDPKDPTKKIWVGNYPAVPAVQAIVDAAKKKADELGAVKLGDITADFNRARQSDGKTENRGGESTLGNFVADVQKWSTGADFAVMNPGGLRANLTYASSGAGDADGSVSYREAATVQPFANTLMTVKLTGAQVKQVLEQQWQPAGSARPFLKLGVSKELTYTYDPAAPAATHITGILVNGTPIDPAATYTVGANAFLAAGGDAFTAFQQGTDKKDTGKVDLQSMVDWFAANKTASPDLAQRAVGAVLSAPADAAGYKAGESVTLNLSSLAFSAGEKAPGDVTVSLGGTALATTAVNAAVTVDAFDEAGTATLTFTIPEGVTGAQALQVDVAVTGTSLRLPITVAGSDTGSFNGTISVGAAKVLAGEKLTLTGTDFEPGETLTLQLRDQGKKGTVIDLGTVKVGGDGSFTAAPVVPRSVKGGDYLVAATQADGDEATAAVTVVRGKGQLKLGASSVAAGGTVTISGSGLEENEKVALELHSTPVSLGSATADADGAFTATVTIPAGTAAGQHHVVAILSDGSQISVEITVVAAGSGGGLALTGADSGSFLLLALVLLALGLGLVVARRRLRVE